jgi:soluble P-type ATPase
VVKKEAPMFEIEIPGFGAVKLEHLVSDFTGTLSVDGLLLQRVKGQLNEIRYDH